MNGFIPIIVGLAAGTWAPFLAAQGPIKGPMQDPIPGTVQSATKDVAAQQAPMCCQTNQRTPGAGGVDRARAPLDMTRQQAAGDADLVGWRVGGRWYFGSSKDGAPNPGFVREGESSRLTLGTRGLEIRVRF